MLDREWEMSATAPDSFGQKAFSFTIAAPADKKN